MITINLKPGTRRRAKTGSPFAGSLDRLKALPGRIKDPLPMAAVAIWVILIGFAGFVWISSAARLRSLGPELEQAQAENRRFRQFLAQKRKAESVRDSIVAQIATIRQVDGDRYVWPHVLDEVTRALPSYTWLTELVFVAPPADPADTAQGYRPPPVGFQLNGRTIDIGGFTSFMRRLEDSPWLGDVTAVSANTVVESQRAVTSFVLRVTFTPPDTAHIRTVRLNVAPGGR